ncbi:LPIN [Lepeophtheirus salmonis]|uniref:phosphatidate phosphatase n=1 Tax=Lepeophtheirus salmonis TaxID=72036 RepID=A0A7R8CQ65_LEPSM|nr:LPIN [Lepeophtheirus salmonis]CAF2890221.1 LPIN [Lepeophtheirus salmonis]
MSFLSSAFNSIRTFYGEINSATLTGAIDVVVVEQKDGSYLSSPFHVRFGKLGVLKAREKIVSIEINGESVDIQMKLDDAGTAFFVEQLREEECPDYLATSPIPNSEMMIEQLPKIEEKPPPPQKSKKKRKTRQKHSRSGSKTSLREINLDIFEMDDVDGDVDESDEETTTAGAGGTLTQTLDKELEELVREMPSSRASLTSINLAEIDKSFLGSRIPRSISENEKFEADLKKDGTEVNEPDELEKIKPSNKPEDDTSASWRWGELPSTSTSTPVTSTSESKPLEKIQESSKEEEVNATNKDSDAKKWSIFNYLRSSRKDGANSSEGGVYLDDINDEEMLAMYVGASRKYEDAESGNGPSLPMSPRLVERRHNEDSFIWPNISFSLCGYAEGVFSPASYEQSIISFDDFMLKLQNNDPVFEDPNLVVKIHNNYYSWKNALPAVMSWLLYKRPLPAELMPKSIVIPQEEQPINSSADTVPTVVEEIPKLNELENTPDIKEIQSVIEDTTKPHEDQLSSSSPPPPPPPERTESESRQKKSWWPWYNRDSKITHDSTETAKTLETLAELCLGILATHQEHHGMKKINAVPSSHGAFIKGKERFRKTLRLSSDDVKRLNLRDGSNEAEFTVTTPYQGTSYCKCHIYLWKYTDKVVISDIDGTITKSDVLGHIFPIIGRDWAQSGVAQLFSKIRRNGYHMIYLSARAIGQASITKEYLQSIKQGDLCLPDGPLFLNPTSLISAFHREVIEKKPEEFKISCLRDILKLYEDAKNPFYAGYGNRINDAYAYRAGELKHELTRTFQTSYCSQSSIVDHLFPPRTDEFDSPTSGQEFCSFAYWRDPIGEFELPTST